MRDDSKPCNNVEIVLAHYTKYLKEKVGHLLLKLSHSFLRYLRKLNFFTERLFSQTCLFLTSNTYLYTDMYKEIWKYTHNRLIEKYIRHIFRITFLLWNMYDVFYLWFFTHKYDVITTFTYTQSRRRAHGFIERDIHRGKTISISLCINKIRSEVVCMIQDQIKI